MNKENQEEDTEKQCIISVISGTQGLGLKVTEQRVCYQARVIRMNGWLTELEMNVIKKSTVNENADKNDQNSGNDDTDDQSGATENK